MLLFIFKNIFQWSSYKGQLIRNPNILFISRDIHAIIKICRDTSISDLATPEKKVKKKPLPGRAKRTNEHDSPRSPSQSSLLSPPQSPTPDESETPENTSTKKKVRKKKKKHLEETNKDGVRLGTSINGQIYMMNMK